MNDIESGELTDFEICKSIAEIEGFSGHEFMRGVFVLSENYNKAVNESHSNSYSFNVNEYEYNPLTNDALCFKLMVKYEVDVAFNDEWCGINMDYETKGVLFEDIPINKAICLAIIKGIY